MPKVLRETAATLEYDTGGSGVPWPWNVPDGEWTYELYRVLPVDGNRYEVIGGRLNVSPSPDPVHQVVVTNLTVILGNWGSSTKAGRVLVGPMDVVFPQLPPNRHYAEPDILFMPAEKLAIIGRKNVQGAPDLVVEVLSPSTAGLDWRDKLRAYEEGGVAHCWVVAPGRQVLTAYRLEEGKYILEGRYANDATFAPPSLPGLRISLAEVWE